MSSIRKRPYNTEKDNDIIYSFMINNYAINWRNGVPAPFFKYAQGLPWTEKDKNYKDAVWEADGVVVAFCFFESHLGAAFFNLKEGYEIIIPDMIEHAEKELRADDGSLKLNLFGSQKAIIEIAAKYGYHKINEYELTVYDYAKGPLDYQLPEGFSFEAPDKCCLKRKLDAIWKGFDNVTERPEGDEEGKESQNASSLDVVVKNADGEYVCCAGMYLVPENSLAYMEPLSTIAEFRRKGLASAALSEMYRRTIALGATHMTGGSNQFYYDLGFEPIITWTTWSK
jgi:GNAT superfamily N-acetyltransferase